MNRPETNTSRYDYNEESNNSNLHYDGQTKTNAYTTIVVTTVGVFGLACLIGLGVLLLYRYRKK